jgi:hypothetical protein
MIMLWIIAFCAVCCYFGFSLARWLLASRWRSKTIAEAVVQQGGGCFVTATRFVEKVAVGNISSCLVCPRWRNALSVGKRRKRLRILTASVIFLGTTSFAVVRVCRVV